MLKNGSEVKISNSVWDEKMKEDSKETSSERCRKGSESPTRPVHHFGEYPGAPFGTTWKNRTECFNAGVHHNIEAGISGTEADGAFSIVVSGQYKDDKDNGDTILYTGSGGHKLGDRTRELYHDQQWSDFGNQALRKSSETGKPASDMMACTSVKLRGKRRIETVIMTSVVISWRGFRANHTYAVVQRLSAFTGHYRAPKPCSRQLQLQ